MPLGPGGLDSNGIWLYGEDDSEALASDLLNLGMQSVSDALGAGFGKILQVVQASTSTQVTIATTALTDSGLTGTITPTSASSKILVVVQQIVNLERSAGSVASLYALLRGATTLSSGNLTSLASGGASLVGLTDSVSLVYLDSPATTSATTYKTQLRLETAASSGVLRAQVASSPSTITMIEVAA